MKRSGCKSFPLFLAIIGLLSWGLTGQVTAAPKSEKLFDGKDLLKWRVPNPNPYWQVVEGVLVGENDPQNKGSVLYTQKEYKDFVFECEARWEGEIDSGFFVRNPELQVQLGVSRSLQKDMTCSFYTGGKEKYPEAAQAKGFEKILKPGKWNQYKIEAKGDTFTVYLNGRQVSQFTDAKYSKAAPIGLQIHPGLPMKVEFRKIRVREL
ncbi:MAG TPA: DUF1080 domain-containing protein [Clostridia bacterium]|nr:DUF1080 domain-containing protein [Clostridia bacterium]